jgi:putative tributyrin esterase
VRVRRRKPALVAFAVVLLAGIGVAAGFTWGSDSAWPEPVDFTMHSTALRDEIGLRVYFPPGYRDSTKRYPVVYFLHGLPASSSAYQTSDFLRGAMATLGRDAIVVAVQGAREGEPDPEYLDSGPGHNWETAVALEVPRYADAHFRTIASRRGRAIVGLSAGGYGAMLIGLHHLTTFSAIESWSGYFHPTDVTGTTGLDLGSPAKNAHANAHSFVAMLRRTFALKRTLLAFYVGSGDARFRSENELLDRELTAARVPHLFRVYAGGHSQILWSAHAPAWLGLALARLDAPR